MINLDDLSAIKQLDSQNALASINMLSDQCRQAWDVSVSIEFPAVYKNIDHIIIAGMGGSAYGGRIAKSLYENLSDLKIPIHLANGYELPGFTSTASLVILSSYSGTTEETLSCAKRAKEIGAKITGITSGGALAQFLNEGNYPSLIFDPKFNPSQQPRIGVGYMVVGLLGMLAKLGFVPLHSDDVNNSIDFIKSQTLLYDAPVKLPDNPAKDIAAKLLGKIPVIIVADFLEGAAHAVRNPFHETAKQFALYFIVPELNHHLMEGLKFPRENKQLLKFIFIESSLYIGRDNERLQLTHKVVKQNSIETLCIKLKSNTKFSQTMELIQIGAYFTFYLAMLNGADPSQIPWVDYFKKELGK